MNRVDIRKSVALLLIGYGVSIRTRGFRLCIQSVERMLFDADNTTKALSKSAKYAGIDIKSAYKYVLCNALKVGKRLQRKFTPGELLQFLVENVAERAIKDDWHHNSDTFYSLGSNF